MRVTDLLTAAGLGAMRGERLLFTGLSVTVAPGEVLLLRGANGAGKTTLLRLLAGLIPIEAGTLERSVPTHWVGHADGIKPHETPRQHLTLWTEAWGGTPVAPAIDALGLARAADVPARGLSAGQRRRTALARLLLEDRPLWFLDEPFSALDAAGSDAVAGLITGHRANGGAIIAAVHGSVPITGARELTL